MGLSGSVVNFDGLFTNRPPLLVFTIGLITLAFATFMLGLFVKNTQTIPNPEIRNDWKKFLEHLGKIELCATVNPNIKSSNIWTDLDQNSARQTSITVLANVKLMEQLTKLPNQPITLNGNIHLGGWARLCHNGEQTVIDNITLTFSLPSNISQSSWSEVCVVLTGSSTVLLPFNNHTTVCVPSFNENNSLVGQLTGVDKSHPINLLHSSLMCENGSQLAVEYQSQSELTILLTDKERSIISVHLFHTTIFLLCVSLATAMLAAFKGASNSKVFIVEEVPLTQARN